jgi:ribonucleoside-diphosphate reductase alpha chain
MLLSTVRVYHNNAVQEVDPESVASTIARLAVPYHLVPHLDYAAVATKTIRSAMPEMSSAAFASLCAETAAYMATDHPDYTRLAAAIELDSLYQQTPGSLVTVAANCPQVSENYRILLRQHIAELEPELQPHNDTLFDFFGLRSLITTYLLRDDNGNVLERPQEMFMRVALAIHKDDINEVKKMYLATSRHMFTMASPTLFNAGTKLGQLCSCFMMPIQEDSVSGIFSTVSAAADISKAGGGIGISVSNVRAKGSVIRSTGGASNGIVPMLRLFNESSRYVNQGGKRPGSIAVYMEPWHADIFAFLEAKRNSGAEQMRARDLYYALWIPDLFMERVRDDGIWSLFCPTKAPRLDDVHGDDFKRLYVGAEQAQLATRVIRARELWDHILTVQMETGGPYMVFKDTANRLSNQKNCGTIKCSNLCSEIIQFSDKDNVAVCNLASMALPRFVRNGGFDYEGFSDMVRLAVRALNRVIDVTRYPSNAARFGNTQLRPIGLGVQGLADVFLMLNMPFDSLQARAVNQVIFETMYRAALEQSCDLARRDGPYNRFQHSPYSKGLLHFDMMRLTPALQYDELRAKISVYGLRNSLLTAVMPTAGTSQLLGNNECIEPYTSNIYTRSVLAGDFVIVNRHLVQRLETLGLWNTDLKNAIVSANGSVQDIAAIPLEIKELFKTAWELKQKSLVDLAVDRAPYIDQSQSLNIWMQDPQRSTLSSLHFYTWSHQLKTGLYYLRTTGAAQPLKVTCTGCTA